MPTVKYLSSAVPAAEKPARPAQTDNSGDRIAALEARLEELNNLLVKQQRDEQDYRDNIDESNLSESLLKKINDLEARVAALEQNP